MNGNALDKWAELLLDTGKRNNLINFKDTKHGSVEVVMPEAELLFTKVDTQGTFEALDANVSTERKANQLLITNPHGNPLVSLKSISKRAQGYLEETGVNVAYMAFGFLNWWEENDPETVYRAPLLLAPVSIHSTSASGPWYVTLTEDEVTVNPTFGFKLKTEFGVKMPEYSVQSLNEYVDEVTEAVSKLGWTVTKECKIGIFSFLKINMYQDLVNNQPYILKNDTVQRLLGIESEVPTEIPEHKLENPVLALHSVVDADSSQIEAIEMAKAGRSFVLQGPPGTGKSQTITNIIAECMNDGKKVLFVSEKQAALNVVFDKLRKAGLEEFCLELHSHKANKKEIIDSLCKTLRTAKTGISYKAVEIIESKAQSQYLIDRYEQELHTVHPVINKSVFELYGAYAAVSKATELRVPIEQLEDRGEKYLAECVELLKAYLDFLPQIGSDFRSNNWYGFAGKNLDYNAKQELRAQLKGFAKCIQEYLAVEREIEEKYEIECESMAQTSLWGNFFTLVSESKLFTPYFLERTACEFILSKLLEMKRLGELILAVHDKFAAEYDEELFLIPADEYNKKLTRQFTGKVGRIFNSEYRAILSAIRLQHKQGKKPSYDEAVFITEQIGTYQKILAEYKEQESSVKDNLGLSYTGITTDWNLAIGQIEKLLELFDSGMSVDRMGLFTKEEYEGNRGRFTDLSKQFAELEKKSAEYKESLLPFFEASVCDLYHLPFAEVLEKIEGCLEHFEEIDNWCRFHKVYADMRAHKLLPFLTTAIDKQIPAEELISVYKKNFYLQWLDKLIFSTPELADFTRIAQDRQVENFVDMDLQQFAVSKAQIRAELSAKRPSTDMLVTGSAVSTLLREGEKKRRQKSIRTLLDETGELVQLLKPCFLMSPLSVSTYLTADAVQFDVVIFDEASQIFPQDAVGAIYRGKQLIVVGDTKQMPPSNFFTSSVDVEDTEEETGDVSDFESILDICTTILPQIRLKWHYRSKCEELIQFSNKNFYENELVTFPSPKADTWESGVDYYFADGVFDRTSKNNEIEAAYVVDLIWKHAAKFPDRSLGVVAFSVSQQDLIEKLLDAKRIEDPSLESFFAQDAAEPFFIKNLETVQGDERDTIIFSVGYGKDSAGKFLHNFGPLNRVGGERRLNVAITRAKINVQLVASIHYTDIDLKRTGAEGARLLREYLEYAETGSMETGREILNPEEFEKEDLRFEQSVAEFLRENGYVVDLQVGSSNLKIDLGVKLPDDDDYILAVECDGASYHKSLNARDRDRLRQQILERMGWQFYRIWSTDWFRNSRYEQDRLLSAVESAAQHRITHEEIVEEVYEAEIEETHITFPLYQRVDSHSISLESVNFLGLIKTILDVEAPMSEEWLLKRLVWLFDREKVTVVVQREYETLMERCEEAGIIRRGGFLYLAEQTTLQMRIPADEATRRDIEYICPEEIAAGMRVVIENNVSIDKENLFRYICKALGFARVAENIEAKLEEAFVLVTE